MSEQLAQLFHETYERLAPQFGYKTRDASAVPWEDVPEQNKRLMIAVTDVLEMIYFNGQDDDTLPDEFMARSGYGHTTRMPFVSLAYNGRMITQMDPENAVDLAHNLLGCAEAAISDAFLMTFARDRIELDEKSAAGLMLQYRLWREQRDAEMEGNR